MKKSLVIILIIYVVLGANCSKSKSDSSNSAELTFWHSFVATTLPVLDDLIADFENENPGIKIRAQYVPTGDALMQKLITALQSNTAPDIAWVHADFLDRLVNAWKIFPLDELVNDDTSFYDLCLPDIFSQLLQAATFRDTLYAIPMEATTLALLYNRDLFQKVGLNPDHPPCNWAELDSFAMRLCNDVNGDGKYDRFGFYVPVFPAAGPLNIWMTMQWTPFVWQAGGDIFRNNQPMIDSDAGVAALSFWRKLYHQQHFERFSMAHDLGFISQAVAMIMDGPWNLPRYREHIKFDWSVAPLPAGAAGRATYLSGEYLVIFRKCKDASAAWQFLIWFVRPEVQRSFAEKSGYLPVRKSVMQNPEYITFLKQYPQQQTFNEQLQYARGRNLPDRFRIEVNQYIAEALESSIRGGLVPEKSLQLAGEKVKRLLTSE